jgi:hypothetical protein
MSGPDLVAQRAVLDRVASLEREQSVLYARQARARAEMSRLWGADQGVVLELAGTARVGQVRAGGQLSRAERLVEHLPVALGLLELGVMRVGTVEIVLELTKSCSGQVQQLLDARLSERICPMDAVDARRLVAASILQVEAELDAQAQRERHERARANRGVWAFGVEDGMARIGAELDQLTARRWSLDFEELVRAQKVLDDRDGITRTAAQRRADVFASLPSRLLALAGAAAKGRLASLLGEVTAQAAPTTTSEGDEVLAQLLRLPVRNPRVLNVHVPMSTLLELDQRSGWLEGFGPVPALHARMLEPVAALRRVAVDPRTGVPLGLDPLTGAHPPWQGEYDPPEPEPGHVGRQRLLQLLGPPMYVTDRAEPQHDPSSSLRAQAQLRDQACDGPGCPRSVSGCELDHETDFALGGPTAVWNLRHRSPRCHHAKHAGWTVAHDLQTAVSTWTSPAGSSYQRGSSWQPPTALPEDLMLPEPRPLEPLDLAPDRPDHDEPLWREPAPRQSRTTRLRGIDPDTVDEHGTPLPQAQPRAVPGWQSDGDPPF